MTVTSHFTPDVPGRGLWTRRGGLLPLSPGSTSPGGFYRLAGKGEIPIGSAYVTGRDRSHSAYVVHLGVKVVQRLAGLVGGDVDGWYGTRTDVAVRTLQARLRVAVDGVVGPKTMRAALTPLVQGMSVRYGVPVPVIGGVMVAESQCDPAAVGVNGYDTGSCQINLDPDVHGQAISVEQAVDPSWALDWTAEQLAITHQVWDGRSKVDAWAVAILHHNSPANATKLAQSGIYPTAQARQYVEAVQRAW